jgi:hypothetical protein
LVVDERRQAAIVRVELQIVAVGAGEGAERAPFVNDEFFFVAGKRGRSDGSGRNQNQTNSSNSFPLSKPPSEEIDPLLFEVYPHTL